MNSIKMIFIDIPSELWNEDLLGKFLSFLWVIMITVVFGTVIGGAVVLIDTTFLTYEPVKANVMEKRFSAAHTETYVQMIHTGKTSVPITQTRNHPDRYYLDLSVNKFSGELQVEKDLYEKVKKGEVINIIYAKNRLTNNLSFKTN